MPEVPAQFSVVPSHQEISRETLAGIGEFIRTFERVTTRRRWQDRVTGSGPEIARQRRSEVCFFSAWDFHLPPDSPRGWQLIEFNDNGSGFLFAALINRLYYETGGLAGRREVEVPPESSRFSEDLLGMVEREAREFFGDLPRGLFLVLDDADSLRSGRFRRELILLRDLFRGRGWRAELASASELREEGGRLRWRGEEVRFVVNRSTDFFWESEEFSALRAVYLERAVYAAPNPFSYATRSDKRLLELLSRPQRDAEVGIEPAERALLSAHVPETWLLRDDRVEDLAARRERLVFKPLHGFAGRGLLASAQVGRSRLRRLLRQGKGYVAQTRVPKGCLPAPGAAGAALWTDLRVWAYRGRPFLFSGRASRRPDVLDLHPPGGWLPTYALAPPSEVAPTKAPLLQ